ncbi:MAG TPA: hypothetical protein VF731_05860 [Solirubrobacterales bacterium]
MTTDGADFVAAGVPFDVLAAVVAPVAELPHPASARTAAAMPSDPTVHFINIRFKFHSLGRLIGAHEAIFAG